MLIDRLHYALGLDTSDFKRGWANADNLLGTMDGKMRALATGAGITALALSIGKIGVQATKMAIELDSAMNEVWSITDKTREEMEGITKDILNLSKQIPERAPALAKAYYQTLSAGITDTNEALEVTAVSAKAATAGLTTTFTVVDAITNVLNAYKREASEAAEISDDLFIAVRDGKINMEQLAPAIGAVVGTAALAKVELKEVLAAIVAMTLSGYSVDESVTSINRLLLSIVDTQDEAKDAAKSLGIEWSVAGMQAKGFQAFIRDLNDKAGDNIEVLQKIVPEVRAFRAAAVIAGTGADAYAKSLDNLRNSAGATDQAFAKIMEGAQKQYELQKNRLNAAFTELGYKILPAVNDGLRIVGDAFEALGLAGETEAKRLQREWQFVGNTIKSVGDLVARSATMQNALTTLLAPGQSPMQTIRTVEQVTTFLKAFPLLSERALQIQQQEKITAGELVEALQSELQYMKDMTIEAEKLNLQDKQRLIDVSQLNKYGDQIKKLQKEARALGMEDTYSKLGQIWNDLKASEKAWNEQREKNLLQDGKSVQAQIALAQAAAAAKEGQAELSAHLVDSSQRLLVSDAKLVELDKIRADLAKESAKARGSELEKMRAIEKVKIAPLTLKSGNETNQLLPAMPVPQTESLKVFNSQIEKLWASFLYGEDAANNLTFAGMKLADTLFEGDQSMRQFASGFIELASGLATSNPLGVLEGIIDVFGGIFGSGSKAKDATKSLADAMEDYTNQVKDMTYAQLLQEQKDLAIWWNKLNAAERIGYADYFKGKWDILNQALGNFGKWSNDFAGMIDRWNYEVKVLNVEDPVEKFRMLVRYAKQYLGIDLPTEIQGGFDKVKMFLDSLGAGANVKDAWMAAFGMAMPLNVTDEQLRDLIAMYKDALLEIQQLGADAAVKAATKTDEESVGFTRTKQITYRQADEMILALWSIDQLIRDLYRLMDTRLSGAPIIIQQQGGSTAGNEAPSLQDLIAKVNLYVTNCYISSQNTIVDVTKGSIYIGGTSFAPDTYGQLLYQESNRLMRSQGATWAS